MGKYNNLEIYISVIDLFITPEVLNFSKLINNVIHFEINRFFMSDDGHPSC